MFRHYPPNNNRFRPPYIELSHYRSANPKTRNPHTHPSWIHLRENTLKSSDLRADYAGNSPCERRTPGAYSSLKSSDLPPGFECKKFDIKDPKEGFWNFKHQEETEKRKQERNFDRERCNDEGDQEELRATFTIHISNISIHVSEEDIRRCCSVFGKVKSIRMYNSTKIRETIFCFVNFEKKEQAEVAVTRLRGIRRCHKFWRVGWALRDVDVIAGEDGMKTGKLGESAILDDIIGVESREIGELMKKSWLLVTNKHKSMDFTRSILEEKGIQVITLVRWGLYGVIAVLRDEASSLLENKLHELEKLFVKVEKLDVERKTLPRYCWIEVGGIPVQAWSYETMENVAKKWGNLVAIDKETDMAERIDVAKLLIETFHIEKLDSMRNMKFKGEDFKLKIEEFDRIEMVGLMKSKDDSLWKQLRSPEKSMVGVEGSNEVKNGEHNGVEDGAEKKETHREHMMVHKEKFGEPNEGCIRDGGTQVGKTTDNHMRAQSNIPIFTSDNVEHKKTRVTDSPIRNRGREVLVRRQRKEKVCTCCDIFRCKNKSKVIEVDDESTQEEEDISADSREVDLTDPSNKGSEKIRNMRSKNSPKKRGLKGVKFGKLMLKEVVGKNGKKGHGRRNAKKGTSLELQDCTSRSSEVVREGLELCEEIGLKIRDSSSKKQEFEDFILGRDHSNT